eukprot:1159714-Pleurochrysis_carterae.AAC.1
MPFDGTSRRASAGWFAATTLVIIAVEQNRVLARRGTFKGVLTKAVIIASSVDVLNVPDMACHMLLAACWPPMNELSIYRADKAASALALSANKH